MSAAYPHPGPLPAGEGAFQQAVITMQNAVCSPGMHCRALCTHHFLPVPRSEVGEPHNVQERGGDFGEPRKNHRTAAISSTPPAVTTISAVSIVVVTLRQDQVCSMRNPRSRSALVTTLTDDSAIAADAKIGLSSQPVVKGYKTPAASGMPSTL